MLLDAKKLSVESVERASDINTDTDTVVKSALILLKTVDLLANML